MSIPIISGPEILNNCEFGFLILESWNTISIFSFTGFLTVGLWYTLFGVEDYEQGEKSKGRKEMRYGLLATLCSITFLIAGLYIWYLAILLCLIVLAIRAIPLVFNFSREVLATYAKSITILLKNHNDSD